MPSRFADTMRSLEAERARRLWLGPALTFLFAWLLWLSFAEVNVYASAAKSRLEVSRMAYHVTTAASGRVTMVRFELGRQVEKGDVLVELDATSEQSLLAQRQAERAGVLARMEAVNNQLAVERVRSAARLKLDTLAAARAGLGVTQARAMALYRRQLRNLKRELHDRDFVSRIDALTAGIEFEESRIKVDDSSLEVTRLEAARDYESASERSRVAELERQLVEIRAEERLRQLEVEGLEAQLAQRRVLAPAAGRLGNVVPLRPGDVVAAASVLATVIPPDDVHVVAEFPPDEAAGHILPGQHARVRLRGFSWVEYGSADATVLNVATEPHQGTLRVELALAPTHGLRVPLQHGLPSQVDVQVAARSPWALVLRSLGGLGRRAVPLPEPATLLSTTEVR